MPQTVLKKTAQKRSATARKPATSVTAKPASTSTRTATARRTKKATPRPVSAAKPSDSTNDEEHFEWPPILRVRGKGNLTRKQIRQIVLEAMQDVADEENANLQSEQA